jgi:hypothetical protein
LTFEYLTRTNRLVILKEMNNLQLYIALAIPALGILVNVGYFVALNQRMTALEGRVTQLGDGLGELRGDVKVLNQGFSILLSKLEEMERRRG